MTLSDIDSRYAKKNISQNNNVPKGNKIKSLLGDIKQNYNNPRNGSLNYEDIYRNGNLEQTLGVNNQMPSVNYNNNYSVMSPASMPDINDNVAQTIEDIKNNRFDRIREREQKEQNLGMPSF